jgi:hypothetical protein
MDIFTLEPLPARYGDSLLLHFGPAGSPGTILIDGGPARVYEKSLRPRLEALAQHRPGGDFKIDLLMISHIDEDHVLGILDFTEEWRQDQTGSWPFKVEALWHNSFERIAGGKPSEVQASILASFGTETLADIAELDTDGDEGHDHDKEAVYKVLASVGQGSRLRGDAEVLGLDVNPGFDDHLVTPRANKQPEPPLNGLTLHVVGPLPEQIKALRDKFAKELPKGLAAYDDESVPNLSSIVVLARYDDKSILLTGDARGDYILEGLEAQDLIEAGGKLHVDILKMQHHGSNRNTDRGFFERITAETYVASADGTYENPDRETFEMLISARPKADRYTIHLTYEIDAIDKIRKAERAKSIATAVRKGKKPPATWDDKTHALATLFAARKADGYRFAVTTPATRANGCIDLLGPVTF